MKDIGQCFDDWCTKHQSQYPDPEIARHVAGPAYFAGAAAMASLFAEGGFIGFEERAKAFAKLMMGQAAFPP
jgi:hypothetical protein